MTRLGGRKFIGFILLTVLGLVCVARGIALDSNVVALLLGAYGIFAGTNLMAARGQSDPASGGIDEPGMVDYLNANLVPHINSIMNAQKETSHALSVITETVSAHAQVLGGARSKVAQQAPSPRPMPAPSAGPDGGVNEVRDLASRIMNGENPYSPRS